MPAKRKPATSGPPAAAAGPPEAFTKERFERELQDLAAKAEGDTWEKKVLDQGLLVFRSAAVVALLGVASVASELALSPVFGSIPASAHHAKVVMGGCFVGWAANLWIFAALPFSPAVLMPIIAAYVPTVQFLMFKASGSLTAAWGPLATEMLTLFPLLVVSAACVATWMDDVDLGAALLPRFVAEAAPGLGSWGLLKLAEGWTREHMGQFAGRTFFHTRMGLEMLVAACLTAVAPSRLLVATLPGLLHTAMFNTHVLLPAATDALNGTLMRDNNWVLLDRWESVTGYVSVLESRDQGFRVMRCDHSLLGGEWVKYKGPIIAEPIYAVFAMLEAVRLVVVDEPVQDDEASALVIGLGVGTTPSAFITHGIDTTIVEIDPIVHEFAQKYFNLPENHTPVIADAVAYTAHLAGSTDKRFDYIVHDVFTGGAEPVALFTLEFLQGLSSLLKPEGVIAINYAGDFLHPSPKVVVRTIREVFPTCRIFREVARDAEAVERDRRDFTNMVIFCRKTTGELSFRPAVAGDFLGSRARETYLFPRFEVHESEFLSEEEAGILRGNETDRLARWQEKSALGHWTVMRTVIPAKIWEMW